MMDLNKWTQKAQEALQAAKEEAIRRSQQEVDTLHLLAALLAAKDGLAVTMLERLGVSIPQMRARAEEEMDKLPRITGHFEEGKIYITQALQSLLVKASDTAAELKDEYLSVEHLLLAMIDEGGKTTAGRILSEAGVDKRKVLLL